MAKTCSACGQILDSSCFYPAKNRKDGLQSMCKGCGKERSARYHQEHRVERNAQFRASSKARRRENQQFVFDYLSQHPCVGCQEDDVLVLQFDHVRGEKKESISRLLACGFPRKTIEAEIAKCEVRCANCHTRKTLQERGGVYRLALQMRAASRGPQETP